MEWILYLLSFIVIIYYLLQWKSRLLKFKNNSLHKLLPNTLTLNPKLILQNSKSDNNNIKNNDNNNIKNNDNNDNESFVDTSSTLNPYCKEYITPVNNLTTGYYNEDDTNTYASANPNKNTYLDDKNNELTNLEIKRALHIYPINRMDLNKKSIQKYEMLKKIDKTVLSKEDYEDKYEWIDKIGQQLDIPNDFNKVSKLEDLEKAQTRTLIDSITDYDEQKWNCQRIYQECGSRLHPNFALKPYSYQEYDKFLDKLLND